MKEIDRKLMDIDLYVDIKSKTDFRLENSHHLIPKVLERIFINSQ